jgi:DNA polymerase I
MASARASWEPTPPPRPIVPDLDLDGAKRLDAPAAHVARRQAPRFSTDPGEALRAIAKADTVAIDLETKGLHPHASDDAAIGAVIIKAGKKRFILRELPDWWPELLEDEGTAKLSHNAKFDLMWQIEFCPREEGQVFARNIQDTLVKSQLVHKYRTPSGAVKAGKKDQWIPNDLATVAQEHLGVKLDKAIDHDVTDWTGHWSDEMIEYMLDDIDWMIPINRELDKKLRAKGQERVAKIECDTVFGTSWMTLNGMQADVMAWEQQIKDWRNEHSRLLETLQEMWPGVNNFNSTQQIRAASAQVIGSALTTTKKSVLKQMAPDFIEVSTLLAQRKIATRLKNWGPTFLRNFVCPICTRFHPSWNQIGAETGRFSCSRPNAQQFPREAEFRKMIVAKPGYVIISLDYSAIEVVAAAVLSGDKKLLEACRTGDPHLATARMISGDDTITKADPRRQNAKIANFGLLFGGGADSLVAQARDLFDIIISRTEAQQIINDYFTLYKKMKRLRSQAYNEIREGPDQIEVVNSVGFIRVLEGWNRKPTSILNTKIQSDAGYGIKSSFPYLMECELLPFLIGQIHDELLLEAPEDQADEIADLARRCMLRGMYDVLGRKAPVTVSVDIARWWT